MGKRKQNTNAERQNVPKISSASRKLAAKRLDQLNPGGLPSYMREIKCQSKEPLAPISRESDNNILDATEPLVKETEDKFDKNNSSQNIRDISLGNGTIGEDPVNMTKQPMILDDNIFTFKPKVSTASARLVENLGTDFMTRQQQHLEKQKKIVSILIGAKGNRIGSSVVYGYVVLVV